MGKTLKRTKYLAVDTGGTFTDLVLLDPAERGEPNGDSPSWSVQSAKVLSTPEDPSQAILQGIRLLGAEGEGVLLHGSTIGLNALLTGSQARVALVTNEGFEDILEIGRQTRSELYTLHVGPRPVLVPRELRLGIPERRLPDGRILRQVTKRDTHALLDKIRALRPDALAICLLHSYAFPEDEHRIAEALRPLGLPITCSADLMHRHREFERFQTAVANASLIPVMGPYLQSLAQKVHPKPIYLAQNEGGLTPLNQAQRAPIRVVLSGPSGGAAAAKTWARACGYEMALGFDMGGTSADVALCGGPTEIEDETQIGPFALALPSVPLITVGCGGGSILHIDQGGALRVGPESAGAHPGPACYGKGQLPTLTDAHFILGRLPSSLVDGSFPLQIEAARKAIEPLAKQLGTSLRATCEAALEIADLQMARPLRRFSVGRGLDPAELALVAFGGAGGLHACRLATLVGIPTVLIPPRAGVLSAEGMLLMPEIQEQDLALTLEEMEESQAIKKANLLLKQISKQVPKEAKVHGFISLRYKGSDTELWVPLQKNLRKAFHRSFQRRFGFTQDLEVECLRIRARVELHPMQRRKRTHCVLSFPPCNPPTVKDSPAPSNFLKRRHIGTEPRKGPVTILDPNTTTVVEKGWSVQYNPNGCLILHKIKPD